MAENNHDQVEYWNGEVGQRWAMSQRTLDAIFAPLTQALFERAALDAGGSVLDIGCGAGETSLRASQRLGPGGHVLAADLSAPMLAVARERAAQDEAPRATIAFVEADAQSHDFGMEVFDHALSRFGVMFFADSVAAFANIRRALVPGGRLTFLCWRGIEENDWVSVPRKVVLRLVPDVEPPPADAPGPFRFAESRSLLPVLDEAGFRDVTCAPLDRLLTLGRSADGDDMAAARVAANFVVDFGPVSRMLRDRDPSLREAARAAVTQRFAGHVEAGAVRLGAACWLVSAGR